MYLGDDDMLVRIMVGKKDGGRPEVVLGLVQSPACPEHCLLS